MVRNVKSWASLVVQMVKNPPAMWDTWVRFLGWEDPLEDGMATHSSILACRIPWTEEPGCKESEMTEVTEHARMHNIGQEVEVGLTSLGSLPVGGV